MARLLNALILVVLLSTISLVGCAGAEELPEPEPASPPAQTPIATPIPEHSTVEASLFGNTISFDLGLSGQIWDPVEATSADGNLTIGIEYAAFAWDENQAPITSLTVGLAADPPAGADNATHIIANTYAFGPGGTTFSPPMTVAFAYSADAVSTLGLTEENISLAYYDDDADLWQKVRGEIDTDVGVITAPLGMLKEDYMLTIIAAAEETEEMTELDVKLVYITDPIATNAVIEVILKTLPGATVMLQPVTPKTNSRSSWPKAADGGKIKVADENGEVSYAWSLHQHTARGVGNFEILATTNTDPDFLSQINASMTRRQIEAVAEDENTVFVEIPFTVAISDK